MKAIASLRFGGIVQGRGIAHYATDITIEEANNEVVIVANGTTLARLVVAPGPYGPTVMLVPSKPGLDGVNMEEIHASHRA